MKENKADRDFEDNTPIIWAPKVTPEEIRRLYQTDAMGIKDEFLIDDVGCGLYARCRTIWIATERRCLECTAILVVDKIGKYSVYVCPDCGWTVRRRLYIFSRVLPCEKISQWRTREDNVVRCRRLKVSHESKNQRLISLHNQLWKSRLPFIGSSKKCPVVDIGGKKCFDIILF